MGLSHDLISQFVKVTKDNKKTNTASTVYGTVVESDGRFYVKLDGSELLTPIERTTNIKAEERVTVRIQNHTATVTGNISSPAARTEEVEEVSDQVSKFENIMADSVTTEDLQAVQAIIDHLIVNLGEFAELEAVQAEIEKLVALYAELEYMSAQDIEAINAIIENLTVMFGEFENISAEQLDAINADIQNLQAYNADFVYVSAEQLSAVKADIQELDVEKLSVKDADILYANIDFANIGEAAVERLLADFGLIDNLVFSEGHVTGELVGVHIKGDRIDAGTLKVDRLIVKGSDGNYYAINTDFSQMPGVEPVEEDSIHGSVLVAESVTAEKIYVDDLVAFDATIGGFNISDHAIYSGVKSSIDNSTRGLYMDRDGQLYLGDANSHIKYFKDANGTYKLAITLAGGKTVEEAIEDGVNGIQVGARNLIRNSENLIFEDYFFVDGASSSVLGVARLGLLTLGADAETETYAVAEASETETETVEEVETTQTTDYSYQGFVDGMKLHDYHLIAMEKAIIAALGGVPTARITTISLPASGWTGSGTIYSQAVTMSGVTANSKIDLLPSPEQLNELLLAEISLTAANSDGAITVFALGAAPSTDLELQAMITEVIVPEVST